MSELTDMLSEVHLDSNRKIVLPVSSTFIRLDKEEKDINNVSEYRTMGSARLRAIFQGEFYYSHPEEQEFALNRLKSQILREVYSDVWNMRNEIFPALYELKQAAFHTNNPRLFEVAQHVEDIVEDLYHKVS